MSSFGNRGQKPEGPSDKGKPSPWRGGSPGFQNRNQSPRLKEGQQDNYEETGSANWPARSSSNSAPAASEEAADDDEQTSSQKIDVGRRCCAFIFDCIAGYLLGMILTVIPFIVHFANISTTWALVLLVRDWLFDGRGIGKNLMGLQVIDVQTGQGCSLKQSVLRNIVILGPFAILQVFGLIMQFVPVPWLTEAVKSMINLVGMVYLAVMLPVECYRAYTRDDGLRYGDQLAGTTIVEAPMDFSNPFSKR